MAAIMAIILCLLLTACFSSGTAPENDQEQPGTESTGKTPENTKGQQSADQNQPGGNDTADSPEEIVRQFFLAFETADYKKMRTYCTQNCIDSYFHEKDVFGMAWARALKISSEQADPGSGGYKIYVDVEMETVEASALYPSTETSFFVVLVQSEGGSWLIDSFVTG